MYVNNIVTYFDLFLAGTEQSDAQAIVRKAGALPLALDQAGSYVSSLRIPFSKYLLQFEGAFARVTAKKPPGAVWKYRDDTVFTTWEVSFNALGSAAQELLLLFGFFDNASISEELLPRERLNHEFVIGEPSFSLVHPINILKLNSSSRTRESTTRHWCGTPGHSPGTRSPGR